MVDKEEKTLDKIVGEILLFTERNNRNLWGDKIRREVKEHITTLLDGLEMEERKLVGQGLTDNDKWRIGYNSAVKQQNSRIEEAKKLYE